MKKRNQKKIVIPCKKYRKHEAFVQVPSNLLRVNITPVLAFKLYVLLLDYAWDKSFCFPSQTRLAYDLGITERSVRRLLYRLQDLGYLSIERTDTHNIYHLADISFRCRCGKCEKKRTGLSGIPQTDLSDRGRTEESLEEDSIKNTHSNNTLGEKTKTDSKKLDPEKVDLSKYDDEAIAYAEELNNLEDLNYYQSLIRRRDNGELQDSDLQIALWKTKNILRTDKVDGTNFWKKPGALFVKNLNKILEKNQKEKLKKLTKKISDKKVFGNTYQDETQKVNQRRNAQLNLIRKIAEND